LRMRHLAGSGFNVVKVSSQYGPTPLWLAPTIAMMEAGIVSKNARTDELLWCQKINELFVPGADTWNQVPIRASVLFEYDANQSLAAPGNKEILEVPKTPQIIAAFSRRALAEPAGTLTAERFKAIMNEVKAETGAKGKELFHPVRIMLTGSHS